MNRRTALQSLLAGIAAPLACGRTAKAETPFTIMRMATCPDSDGHIVTIDVKTNMDREWIKRQIMAAKDPDYIPEPEGNFGKTYFKVGSPEWARFPSTTHRLFFDGVDVTNRTVECDLVGQWVRMQDMDAIGNKVIPRRLRTHYGKVELRPT